MPNKQPPAIIALYPVPIMTSGRVDSEPKTDQEPRPRASLQLVVYPHAGEWIYAILQNQPQTELYDGSFVDPFESLNVTVTRQERQLAIVATIGVGHVFNQDHGPGIGSKNSLAPFLNRYPQSELSQDGRLLIVKRNNQPYALISRADDDYIRIIRGGQAGQLVASDERPVNNLKVHLDEFAILTQRYVSALMKTSDGNQRQVVLDLVNKWTDLSEGTVSAYLASFEITGQRFMTHERPVDLDSEIGGFPNVKAAIRGLYLDLTDPERSRAFGTQPFSNRFILLSGAEGTGKSLFLKALNNMLQKEFGVGYQHFRLPITDILQNYGPRSRAVLESVLEHVRENEKDGITTLLHLDKLDALIPAYNNQPEYEAYTQTVAPIVMALKEFGQTLGAASHNVVVIGESRAPQAHLPEGVQRTFRRIFRLEPTRQDLTEALAVQIRTSKSFAERTDVDPFATTIDDDLPNIISNPVGLTGRDMQQVILDITDRHKASGQNPRESKITAAEIADAISDRQSSKGIDPREIRGFGFLAIHHAKH